MCKLLLVVCAALAALAFVSVSRADPLQPLDIALAERHWTAGNTHTVYLQFAADPLRDAHQASTNNGRWGPVLLVNPTDHRLQIRVRRELERLRPCEIATTGTEQEVPDHLLQEADELTAEDDKCDDPQLQALSEEAFDRWLDDLQVAMGRDLMPPETATTATPASAGGERTD